MFGIWVDGQVCGAGRYTSQRSKVWKVLSLFTALSLRVATVTSKGKTFILDTALQWHQNGKQLENLFRLNPAHDKDLL